MIDNFFQPKLEMPSIDIKNIILIILLICAVFTTVMGVYIPEPWVATTISFLGLFVLPGFLLSQFLINGVSIVERLAISFVLGFGLLSPCAILFLNLHLNLSHLRWLVIGVDGVLLIIHLKLQPQSKKVRNITQRSGKHTYLLVGTFALGLLLVLVVFLSTAVVWRGGDRWVYLAYIRQYLDSPHLVVTYPFFNTSAVNLRIALNGWLVLLSLLSEISRIDPVSIFSIYLPPLLMIISLLIFYSLAFHLFQNANIALLTSSLQVLHYLTSIIDEGPGTYFFIAIPEDKYFAWLILLPATLLFALRFLNTNRKIYLIAIALSVVNLALIHPLALPLFILCWGGFALIYIPLNLKNKEAILRVLICLIIALIFLSIPFIQRLVPRPNAYSLDDDTDPSLQNRLLGQANGLLIFSQESNSYIAHPILLRPPLTVLTILCTPFLAKYVRKSMAAQFVISNVIVVLLLLYNPLITPLLGRIITPWMIRRISWIFPSALASGFVLFKAVECLVEKKPQPLVVCRRKNLLLKLALFSVTFMIVVCGFIDTFQGVNILIERQGELLPRDELLLLRALDEITESSEANVMAPPGRINLHIPAYSANSNVLTVRRSEASTGGMDSILSFYQKQSLDCDAIETMREQDVEYVILTNNNDTMSSLGLSNLFARKVYENETFVLYEIFQELLPDCSIFFGDLCFRQGMWSNAFTQYSLALEYDPRSVLAHLGLAQVYQANEQSAQALSEYRKAIVIASSENQEISSQIIEYISQNLDIDPEYLFTFFALTENYERWQGMNTEDGRWNTYCFIDPIDPNENYENVEISTFIADRRPKPVILQHPQSWIEYMLYIPTMAHLNFHLALSPEVWHSGYGDGVQFDVTVDDGTTTTHPFSEYIDPKSVPAHRQWHDREIDLSPWAGQTVTLTLSTGCGPNDDCRYDWAGWGEPRIVQPIAYNFLSELPSADRSAGEESIREDTLTIDYESRPILFQHPTSRVIYQADMPEHAGLHFGLGMDPSVWAPEKGDGVEYTIYVRDPDEPLQLHRVFQHYLDPKNDPDDRHWHDYVVDLSPYAGQTVDIIFETQPGPEGDASFDWVGWSMPVLVADDMAVLNPDPQVAISVGEP